MIMEPNNIVYRFGEGYDVCALRSEIKFIRALNATIYYPGKRVYTIYGYRSWRLGVGWA